MDGGQALHGDGGGVAIGGVDAGEDVAGRTDRMTTAKRRQLLEEKAAIESALGDVPDSCILDRMSFEVRKEAIEKELLNTHD